jgi:hypothetical protein
VLNRQPGGVFATRRELTDEGVVSSNIDVPSPLSISTVAERAAEELEEHDTTLADESTKGDDELSQSLSMSLGGNDKSALFFALMMILLTPFPHNSTLTICHQLNLAHPRLR